MAWIMEEIPRNMRNIPNIRFIAIKLITGAIKDRIPAKARTVPKTVNHPQPSTAMRLSSKDCTNLVIPEKSIYIPKIKGRVSVTNV